MSNSIFSNGSGCQLVVLSADQLEELANILSERIQQLNEKNDTAEREQLRPATWWCERLGVNRATLWRWEREGRISGTRINRNLFFKASDFENVKKGGHHVK